MSNVEIVITEQHGKRELSRSNEGRTITINRSFLIYHAETEQDASTALRAFIDSEINVEDKVLTLDSIAINEFLTDHWEADATWIVEPSNVHLVGGGDRYYDFNISSTTQHISQSRETMARYAKGGGTATDYMGAIGVTRDGIAGVDILVPIFNFSESVERSPEEVNVTKLNEWAILCGQVNNSSFKGFAAGEVLFTGCSGSRRQGEKYKLTFHFAVQKNASGFQIGDINVATKQGWDYLWILYEDSLDEAEEFIIKLPKAAYVERVYLRGGFGVLGI